ncbi:MAG: CoA transferase [Candidatus Nanopelagicaceae bacterium]|nr:CoA transferase [Candidatus Nanopelagicaceae bacterium]
MSESPPEKINSIGLPLSGVRVLDATSNIAGPFSGAILADLGATVIKIETPLGDPTRSMAPVDGDRSAYFHVVNRNKSAISIDLKSVMDRARLDEMLDECDVFLTNFLPSRLETLHLTPAELMSTRPALIFGNLSSYGVNGPNASTPGYDATVQARTGIMHLTGELDGPPVRAGVSVLDIGSGMWLAIGILAALVKRNESGEGSLVETSLFETGALFVSYHLSANELHGKSSVRSGSSHPTFGPYGLFETMEGTLCIGVGNDKIFSKLCNLIGRADLILDPRFITNSDRVARSQVLKKEIELALAQESANYWAERLGNGGVPADRVALPEDLHEDLQAKAMDVLLPYPDETTKVTELPGIPVRFNGKRPPIRMSAPHLNKHGNTEKI